MNHKFINECYFFNTQDTFFCGAFQLSYLLLKKMNVDEKVVVIKNILPFRYTLQDTKL